MSKLLIVGAGIAGLSCAIYAQKSGFNVHVYEAGNMPGGNCTAWRRKGYHFEGGLHWLTGSSPTQMIHRLWQELGAIKSGTEAQQTQIIVNDPFRVCENDGRQVCLYRDVEKLKAHLIEVSPQDKLQIKKLCRDINRFKKFGMPIMDIFALNVSKKAPSIFAAAFKMLPALLRVPALSKLSVEEYAERFKHPLIRLLMCSVADRKFDAVSLLSTLGAASAGDCAYIEGGSLTLVRNMESKFKELGGEVHYGNRVQAVQVENGSAKGLLVNGKSISGDCVVVSSDTLAAVDTLFDPPLMDSHFLRMRENAKKDNALVMCCFVSIGVNIDLSKHPKSVIFNLKKPFEYAGRTITSLLYNQYAATENYAPKGCTAITLILSGNTYHYWKSKKEDGTYEACKRELFEKVINALEENISGIKSKVAVFDIATPLTFERYCGTYHGSWMTVRLPKTKWAILPYKTRLIKDLYFAGQRIIPPGGLPVAVVSGRSAAQHLCRDAGVVFRS
ncbi:MAG: FAD-dependent oxidoreductase [Termitinemataceae bacterium]|nr:MAG: FAD-dependent oxidoreductase [Termitinemataceae bacterium]